MVVSGDDIWAARLSYKFSANSFNAFRSQGGARLGTFVNFRAFVVDLKLSLPSLS
jgi:L-asparaginase/Glu-tRNA(Gln) amidotransferase subunit D